MYVVTSMLKKIYESLWISLVLAFLLSLVNLYVKGVQLQKPGWKSLFRTLREHLSIPQFRHSFYLYFYTAMILYQTLLGRKVWEHPLQVVFGGWSVVTSDGVIDVQVVENILIFIPFTMLLFWAYGEKIVKGKTVCSYLFSALKITAIFSLSVELLQALLHLGTLQISDLYYNVFGGVTGGALYWCGYKLLAKYNDG